MQLYSVRRALGALFVCAALGACGGREEVIEATPALPIIEGYGFLEDNDYTLPPIPAQYLDGVNRRAVVEYNGDDPAGTIVVDPHAKLLYFVEEDGTARRYAIAVGRQGMRMRNPSVVRLKREWPSWTPTANMLAREPEVYGPFARGIEGGLASPLGARALYLFQNGRDTHFRIHGTNDLESIGNSGSAGCIRMFNHDIIDLYDHVPLDTRVVIRTKEESVALEGEELANRGVILEPNIIDPELIYGSDDDADEDAAESAFEAEAEVDEILADADTTES